MEKNEVESVAELAVRAAGVQVILDVPHVVVPQGAKVESFEHLLPAPVRIFAAPNFDDANSFSRYIGEFKGERSCLFAHVVVNGGEFTCVLDYHRPEGPSWCSHRAHYDCPFSEEWNLWSAQDGKWKAQREFAEWLESNTAHLVTPSAAEFLEMAQTLSSKTTAVFTGSTLLSTGREQLDYQLTTEAKAGEKGNLTVPTTFTLGLPVFLGGARYEVRARLRHRINEQRKLELRYELVNPSLIIRAAWDDTVTTVTKATGLEVWCGRP